MLCEGEYRVYFVRFPGDIKAVARLDEDGFPSIYINDSLPPAEKKSAFLHEIRHIVRDDHINEKSIQEVELK